MLFQRKTGIEWVVAGLGNPGKKYENTRHNIGFDALDYAAKEWGIAIKKSRFDALCGEGEIENKKVLLIKPQTFMNLSGESLRKALDYYKLTENNLIVLFDDVSLMPGALRIRKEGSAGGHNGLKSIIANVGQNFPRVKIGVGQKPHPDYDLAAWVLGHFGPAERKLIEERFGDIQKAVELMVKGDFTEAMSRYNGVKK